MTLEEFNKLRELLWIEYPSLGEWIETKSPDPVKTLQSWFRRLEKYTLAECYGVLAVWERSNSAPFAAYERDQVPAIIGSVIDKQKDREAKAEREQRERQEREIETNHYLNVRRRNQRNAASIGNGTAMDSEMAQAVARCKPHHQRAKDGKITFAEYEAIRDGVLRELNIGDWNDGTENHHQIHREFDRREIQMASG